MTLTLTARHADISDTMKAYVQSKLGPVLDAYPSVEHAHVILDIQKFRHSVEVVAQVRHHGRLEAREESDDLYASVDRVLDKVDRQLRRLRDKVVDHKTPKHRTTLSDFEKTLNRNA